MVLNIEVSGIPVTFSLTGLGFSICKNQDLPVSLTKDNCEEEFVETMMIRTLGKKKNKTQQTTRELIEFRIRYVQRISKAT